MSYITYTFTIKKNVRDKAIGAVSQVDYKEICDAIRSDCKCDSYFSYVFEKSKEGLMHVHGIATLHRKIKYIKYKLPGYHIHFKECYNIPGWIAYMKKDLVYSKRISDDLAGYVMCQEYDKVQAVESGRLSTDAIASTRKVAINKPRGVSHEADSDSEDYIDIGDDFMMPPKKRLFPASKNIDAKETVRKAITTKTSDEERFNEENKG